MFEKKNFVKADIVYLSVIEAYFKTFFEIKQ